MLRLPVALLLALLPVFSTWAAEDHSLKKADVAVSGLGRWIEDRLGEVEAIYGEGVRRVADSVVVVDRVAVAPRLSVPLVAAADRNTESRLRILESRIIDNGASPAAVERARVLVRQMLVHADPEIVRRMVDANTWVFILPEDKRMTDFDEFKYLRGQKTFDGRRWKDVRGAGDVPLPGGGSAAVIPEENLWERGSSGAAHDFIFAHEYAHLIQRYGLSAAARAQVLRVYEDSMKRDEKTGLGDYADSNEEEAFAQATAAYFGLGWEDQTAETLKNANPQLHGLMREAFGPERSLKR